MRDKNNKHSFPGTNYPYIKHTPIIETYALYSGAPKALISRFENGKQLLDHLAGKKYSDIFPNLSKEYLEEIGELKPSGDLIKDPHNEG